MEKDMDSRYSMIRTVSKKSNIEKWIQSPL